VTCRWALSDGAYLLGGLNPDERRAYEAHLASCVTCSTALSEVAGLPGLLSRLPADAIDRPEAPPPTLLPALLAAVERARFASRRRLRLRAGVGLAAAAAVIAAVLAIPRIGTSHPHTVALARVINVPITASASLTDRSWGTEINLTCRYTGPMKFAPASYLLVATDRLGHDQQIATWRVVPGGPVVLTAATSLRRSELASLEVRSPTGRPLLRLRR